MLKILADATRRDPVESTLEYEPPVLVEVGDFTELTLGFSLFLSDYYAYQPGA